MTAVDPETRIPDPIELDRAEEERLAARFGTASEYAGFETVGIPERPPQTEREAEMYSLEEGEMLLNMGPQHPSTHGVMRLVLKIRGEVVTDLDPVLGYLHRGIEKLCENATYTTVLTYVDPMDYMSAMHNEHAPAIAFEKLYGISAPKRAEYIRALVVELNRVFSHGLMMGFLALDMGGITPILSIVKTALALAPREPAIRRDEQRLWNELGRPPRVEQPARALAAARLDELLLLLLAASYGFYASWNPFFSLLLALSTGVDFAVGLRLERTRAAAARRVGGG